MKSIFRNISFFSFTCLLPAWSGLIAAEEIIIKLNKAFFSIAPLDKALNDLFFWSLLIFPNSLLFILSFFNNHGEGNTNFWYYFIVTFLLILPSFVLGRMLDLSATRSKYGFKIVIPFYIIGSVVLFNVFANIFAQSLFQ